MKYPLNPKVSLVMILNFRLIFCGIQMRYIELLQKNQFSSICNVTVGH